MGWHEYVGEKFGPTQVAWTCKRCRAQKLTDGEFPEQSGNCERAPITAAEKRQIIDDGDAASRAIDAELMSERIALIACAKAGDFSGVYVCNERIESLLRAASSVCNATLSLRSKDGR